VFDPDDFPHTSAGTVCFDPGRGTPAFEPWWALLECDPGVVEYHAWHLARRGVPVDTASRWGPHICFVRGEVPARPEEWGKATGWRVEFRYAHTPRWDNGRHAWLDVWCPELLDLRSSLGLPAKRKTTFHLTIGRLLVPREPVPQPDDRAYL
jgi:hypothetical protein